MTLSDFIEALEAAGYEPAPYSGRGMYGKRCVGVSVDNVFGFVADVIGAAAADVFELGEVFRYVETDSLGLQTVVYFPRMEWIDE